MNTQDIVAVVTGGASGLGEASVRMLISKGGKAAILDFDEKRGEAIANELGDSVLFCSLTSLFTALIIAIPKLHTRNWK